MPTRVYAPTLTPLARFLAKAVPVVVGLATFVHDGFGSMVGSEVFFGLPVGIFLWRMGNVRLEVDGAGIVSVGPLKRKRLAWSEIDHLELIEGSAYACAVLHDGELVGLPAVQAAKITWLLGRRSHAYDVVDEVNRLRPDAA